MAIRKPPSQVIEKKIDDFISAPQVAKGSQDSTSGAVQVQISHRLPAELLARIESYAKVAGIKRNALINLAITQLLNQGLKIESPETAHSD
ncbi:MAG: hypothetical protein M0O99_00450 [Desulfuromonas thiophila]|jgi:hypothetical protein|nr:hypothetical protein [Desulfuromonas thiophila]